MGPYIGRDGGDLEKEVKTKVHKPDNTRERKHCDMKNRKPSGHRSQVSQGSRDSSVTTATGALSKLTILPELRDKSVRGLVEQRGHVVVQGVHVLHQPLICFVVHLTDDRHPIQTVITL